MLFFCLLLIWLKLGPKGPDEVACEASGQLLLYENRAVEAFLFFLCMFGSPISFRDPPPIRLLCFHGGFHIFSWPYAMCHVIIITEPSGIFEEPPRPF